MTAPFDPQELDLDWTDLDDIDHEDIDETDIPHHLRDLAGQLTRQQIRALTDIPLTGRYL